jgi:transcriptional regulator with XRE-family HTH domain
MDNPIRRIRRALNLNRSDFARLIGKSHQTVGNYETGIGAVPDDVVKKLQSIAAQAGLADEAMELRSAGWQVRHLLRAQADEPLQTAASATHGRDRNKEWHDLLDLILESDDPDAVPSVQSNLTILGKYVTSRNSLVKDRPELSNSHRAK